MDRKMLYDIIYALAARDGREKTLFGNCAPLAHRALTHSLVGEAFPELWFELPLAGDPWFDLHALASRTELDGVTTFPPEKTGGYPEAFAWFAQADNVRQLALSYDVSSGSIEHPALQLLIARKDMSVVCDFLEAAGRADAVPTYRTFIKSLPEGWFACYTGLFPDRQQMGLRVECIPDQLLARSYAEDGALLEEHLRRVGFSSFDDTLIERCQELAHTPFQLEFQFDVMPDGRAGTTLGASVRFTCPPGEGDWGSFLDAGELMQKVQGWGLADGRWIQLGGTAYAQGVQFGGEKLSIYCFPAFLKLRWRDGAPLDAKAYLIAGVQHKGGEDAR